MRIASISVTEASRNFADCVNRVRYQGTTFILQKNGVAVARIVPEPSSQADEEQPAAKQANQKLEMEPAEPIVSMSEVPPRGEASAANPVPDSSSAPYVDSAPPLAPRKKPRDIW